jgi:hypothetical protein
MAFVARRPFLGNGVQYNVGDVVKGFPEEYDRHENLIRSGLVVEQKRTYPAPRKRKTPVEVMPEES